MIALLSGLAALGAIGVAAGRALASPAEPRTTVAVRGALAATVALVSVQAALGGLGLLSPAATAGGLGAVAALALAAAHRAGSSRPPPRTPTAVPSLPPWERVGVVGLSAALLTVLSLRLWEGLHPSVFLYDTLSYHLHAPVTWMHEARLRIVPAVFGDPAPAYAPSNLELWFLFLMAPLGSERLALLGQLPFAALAALAIVAAVREAGGHLAAGLAAALAFMLIPEIWAQAPTTMVDLGMAAFLLSALPFLARLSSAARRWPVHAPDLLCFTAALGLAAGTKYVGLVLGFPFLVAGAVACGRARLRPSPQILGGVALVAIGSGGFWYLRNLVVTGNPIYPAAVPGLPLPALYGGELMRQWDYHLPVSDLGALFEMLGGGGAGLSIAAGIALARCWRVSELPIAAALVVLFWAVIPYQESRFLFPVFGVAAVALGSQAAREPRWLGAVLLGVAIAGSLVEEPPSKRLAGIGSERGRGPVTRYAVDAETGEAWAWFRANVRGARVAFTGNNLAFPLAGVGLSNRVFYVNVAGEPGDLIHDFARRSGARAASAEPALYRDGADPEVWLRNLRGARAEVLFVASMYPIVRRNVAGDAEGFPIERAWADARPERFRLLHASAGARVYAIAEPGP